MTNGRIVTDAANSLIVPNTGTITGTFGSSTYVDGPLIRQIETTTELNLFPVGNAGTYLPLTVTNTSGYTGPKDWTVQYYDENPTTSSQISGVTADFDFTTYMSESNAMGSLLEDDLWEVDAASPASADIRVSWDGSPFVGSDASSWSELRVMVWNDVDAWESFGNGNLDYTGMSGAGGSIITDTEVAFSTKFFTLGAIENTILPVELLEFHAVAENGRVYLDWTTVTEINNDFFEVQRSRNGKDFEVIGTVEGNGDSSAPISYNFVDQSPYMGISYYRLRQVDFNGEFEVLPTRVVNNDESGRSFEFSLAPNPTTADNIRFLLQTGDQNTPVYLNIVDNAGRVYVSETFDSFSLELNEQITPTQVMHPGLYFVSIHQGSNSRVMKLVIK